jgi:glutathione S-transferase
MARATLMITTKNYGSWSMRGWLLCRFAGLEFEEIQADSGDPAMRAELLLLSSSVRVPWLHLDGVDAWDTLAIAELLDERFPEAGLFPADPKARAHCRSVCGEMHAGFANMRSALPMNIRARFRNFPVWSAARADVERVQEIWHKCLASSGGPWLFGARPTVADAMYAPVCTRFVTYGIELDPLLAQYSATVLAHPAVREWIAAAETEADIIEELDVEF